MRTLSLILTGCLLTVGFSLTPSAEAKWRPQSKRPPVRGAKKVKLNGKVAWRMPHTRKRVPFLSARQAIKLEYWQRVKYVQNLRKHVRSLYKVQDTLLKSDAYKNAGLDDFNNNEAVALLLGTSAHAADDHYRGGNLDSDRCLYAFSVQLYRKGGGEGGCSEPQRCKTSQGTSGIQCGFIGSGLSGTQACVPVGERLDSTKWCNNKMLELRKSNAASIEKAISNYEAHLKDKGGFKIDEDGKVSFQGDSKKFFADKSKVDEMLKDLKEHAYDDRAYAHLMLLAVAYKDSGQSFPKRYFTNANIRDLKNFERDFDRFIGGVDRTWDNYVNHCEKNLSSKVIDQIAAGGDIDKEPEDWTQSRRYLRELLLDWVKNNKGVPDVRYWNELSSSEIQSVMDSGNVPSWVNKKVKGKTQFGFPVIIGKKENPTAQETESFNRARVDSVLQKPECDLAYRRLEAVKVATQKVVDTYPPLITAPPPTTPDQPPVVMPEPEKPWVQTIEGVGTGCASISAESSKLRRNSFMCMACAAEREKINHDIKNGVSQTESNLYFISEKWLSFLEVVNLSCDDPSPGGLTSIDTAKAAEYLKVFGHCSHDAYSWDSDNPQASAGDISAIHKWARDQKYNKKDFKPKNNPQMNELVRKVYGIAPKQIGKVFCKVMTKKKKDNDYTRREKLRELVKKHPTSDDKDGFANTRAGKALHACMKESLANADDLYPIDKSRKRLKCDVSFTDFASSAMVDATSPIGHVVQRENGCYVAKQINIITGPYGKKRTEIIYTHPKKRAADGPDSGNYHPDRLIHTGAAASTQLVYDTQSEHFKIGQDKNNTEAPCKSNGASRNCVKVMSLGTTKDHDSERDTIAANNHCKADYPNQFGDNNPKFLFKEKLDKSGQ